jgi:hypothetical protein
VSAVVKVDSVRICLCFSVCLCSKNLGEKADPNLHILKPINVHNMITDDLYVIIIDIK